MPRSKTYEKITDLLGSGFKIHESTFADLIFKGSSSSFHHLLDKLKSIPPLDRPKLLGFFIEKLSSDYRLNIILDFGTDFPKSVLFVDYSEFESIPALSEIWPSAIIWELESMATNSLIFSGLTPGGISWHSV